MITRSSTRSIPGLSLVIEGVQVARNFSINVK